MNERKFVFFSAVTGNILEYYDFTVYSVFAAIIGKTFFPAASEFAQILLSLVVFAVGFITRPIGGILFGYIGDRYGRRISLIFSMLGMTVPTFAMGLIPSYAEIGYYAPVMLVLFRLIQGLCISGEGTGAAIFVLEHYNNMKPGFVTAAVHGTNITGSLIATFIGIGIGHFFPHIEYAWRFAFLLGGFMGIAGFYLRLRVSETPIFVNLAEKKRTLRAPFIHVVKTAWPSMFLTFCVAGVTSSIVYMVKTYVVVFFTSVMHYPDPLPFYYSSYALFILMIAMPIAGYFVDKIGQVIIMRWSVVAVLLLAVPTLLLMSSEKVYCQILSLTMLGSLAGAMSGAAYIFVISLFKPEERFSGVAFSYNFGIAVFGGTSPIISRWLVEVTGLYYAPAFYIMTTASLFIFIMFIMRNLIKKIS